MVRIIDIHFNLLLHYNSFVSKFVHNKAYHLAFINTLSLPRNAVSTIRFRNRNGVYVRNVIDTLQVHYNDDAWCLRVVMLH